MYMEGCYYTGWNVSKWDGVLVNGMGSYFLGCSVSDFAGWSVSKRVGVLLSGMGC